jgi:Holliday junction DNA helicase RuvA
MIAFLRGRVLEKHPNRVIVDVGGVGYDVAVPLSTFYVTGEPGAEIVLRVYTHVREDQIALFGFVTPLEQTVFERLIAINGIGPKLALAVLSGLEPRELVASIQRGDLARLTGIPGVGKKTAERIVLEMRDAGADRCRSPPRRSRVSAGEPRVPSTGHRQGARQTPLER